jgi:hypothetical protein
MAKIGNYPATNAQIKIFDDSQASHRVFEDLVWKAIDALNSMVDLPHENEDGEKVVHGANHRMHYIAQTYYGAAQALRAFYPREVNIGDEYFPFMYLRCRMNGLVHPWIAGMVAENGGIPPRTWAYTDVQRHSQFKTEA